ncbi:MAG: endonuclease III [Ignavibacteria bacterium]|nr:MAG: endonuclease III [Ignavibacteria bacterium]KAF0158328.1 MAG: endonuclease III [Ignavibacteria bacterium]
MSSIKKINELLKEYFGIPKRQNPLPEPFDTLIATILSQNTNDNNSYKAFNNLKNAYANWDEAAGAKRTAIEKLIRVAGLAPTKSRAIKNLLVDIKEKYGKLSLDFVNKLSIEETISKLTSYDGIGVKTASCVLMFAMNKNICPVDTHVHRTTNRIGLVNEKTPDKTFWKLNKNFPEGIAHTFHTNLILLGREICKPTNPNCAVCPLKKVCKFENKNFEIKGTSSNKRILLLDNIGI